MNKTTELFMIFLKIGTVAIGGGYSMIPFIEKEVVYKRNWISKDDFLDMLTLAQSVPGPIAVDVAVYVGYKVAGIWGSIFAVLGSIFTAFAILLFVAMYFAGYKNNLIVERIFKGIRPAVVALIAAPVINLCKNAKINRYTILILILTVIFVAFLNINAIFIIIGAAILGIVYGYIKRRRNRE